MAPRALSQGPGRGFLCSPKWKTGHPSHQNRSQFAEAATGCGAGMGGHIVHFHLLSVLLRIVSVDLS